MDIDCRLCKLLDTKMRWTVRSEGTAPSDISGANDIFQQLQSLALVSGCTDTGQKVTSSAIDT